jgi:polygalacturonase
MKKTFKFPDSFCRISSLQSIYILLLLIIGLNISHAQVSNYPTPPNAVNSAIFQLSSNGQNIPVFKYMDYHYAHFSLSGTANFTVTASGNISSSKISPLSLGIAGTAAGNQLNFALSQIANNDQTPLYLVIQINTLEKLVLLADRPEIGAPASSGTGIYNVTSAPYNADNTGVNYTQPAIQQAIDAASAAGGGTVYVPAGIYKIKENLSVKSNVTLYLAPGSVLKAIDIRSEYSQTAELPPAVIIATGASNAGIKGRGQIDASGFKLMNPPTGFTRQTVEHPRRRIVQIDATENITFDGIMLKDASGWSMDLRSSTNVVCQNIKVLNHKDYSRKIENDGIDMTSSSNSKVNQCFVITIDDAMCAKARYGNMDKVEFSNNVVYTSAAGVKAGMQSVGNMSNIVFRNNDVVFSYRGIGIDTKEGTLPIAGVLFKDIRVEQSNDHCVDFMAANAPINNINLVNCNCLDNNEIRFYGAFSVNNVAFEGLILEGNPINSNADASSNAVITNDIGATYTFGNILPGTKYQAETATITNGTVNNGATGQFVDVQSNGKITWAVNASNAASYTLSFNVGVPTAGTRSMGVYVNGTKRGVITSSLAGFSEVAITAPLNQGANAIEIRDSEGTTELNIDYLKVSTIATRYQAENAVISGGSVNNGATGQFVDVEGGGIITWTIPAPTASTYTLSFNVGVPAASTRSMGVYVNGTKRGVITSSFIGFAETGINVPLNQGNNTVEIRDSEGTTELNVDYLYLATPNTSKSSATLANNEIDTSDSAANDNGFSLYPNPNNGVLNIEFNNEKYNSLNIYTITGMLLYSKELKGENSLTINLDQVLRAGTYLISLQSDSKTSTKKLIVR